MTNLPLDPMALAKLLWPDVRFYDKQKEIIYSVWHNDETVVTAGNELGKDFVAGFLVPAFFLTRHPCRVCTSSTTDDHLDVLWGEIGRFIQTSAYPLEYGKGGHLILGHRTIKKVVKGEICPISKVKGVVPAVNKTAGLQGFHVDSSDGVPRNLWLCDEASGANDEMYKVANGWAKRIFIFGNPWQCNNFFYKAVKGNLETKDPGGDIPRDRGRKGFYRKVIHIAAEDSPNVREGLRRETTGEEIGDFCMIPGIKGYWNYKKHRKMWDEVEQCVKLDGLFHEGKDLYLYPSTWLVKAAKKADELKRSYGAKRKGITMGIDPAEGGDSTVWTVGDKKGFIYQLSKKTADTSVIVGDTLRLMREYSISPENVVFDRGGGGREHADQLRKIGYNVRTVAFGEKVVPERRRGMTSLEHKKLQDEERYAYFNRRSQMYHLLSMAIDPDDGMVYGIPREMVELHRQLRPIPKKYNQEGQVWLPPKNKPPGSDKSTTKTLIEMIGHSPDEADSAVLCYYALTHKGQRTKAGAV